MTQADRQVTGQITWVYTDTLERAAPFYRDTLGLRVVRDAGSALIFETAPGARIGLCETFDGRVVAPEGGMITLLVPDSAAVDAWHGRLSEAGAALRGAPAVLEKFGIYSFFCEDPNGYVLEIQCFLDESRGS